MIYTVKVNRRLRYVDSIIALPLAVKNLYYIIAIMSSSEKKDTKESIFDKILIGSFWKYVPMW